MSKVLTKGFLATPRVPHFVKDFPEHDFKIDFVDCHFAPRTMTSLKTDRHARVRRIYQNPRRDVCSEAS